MNLLPLLSRLVVLTPPVVVIPHENADIDAVASAAGTVRFFESIEKDAVLFAPSLSAPAARLLERLNIDYAADYSVSGRDVVIVDTVSEHMIPVDVSTARKVVMIDHHPGKHPYDAVVYDTSSCSEIIAELLLHNDVRDERIFKALAAGIVADTAGLHAATAQSLAVLSKLLEAANIDMSDVFDLIVERRDISERLARLKALERAEIHRFGDFLVVLSNVGAFEASAAMTLILAGADVALVYSDKRLVGREANQFYKKTGITLLDIFSKTAKSVGGTFGGHPLAAGMVTSDPEEAARAAVDVIEQCLREKGHAFVHRVY